ncbi:acetate/propionate family kinase [Elioraea tepida]|uniref:Acetate kinase n=1 Tax=Elioraea tepida TaxID=2843330 RepID=A0A975U0S9_9PROT|nr:acetate/propionate family kinase [Elioraea tepida]QXM24230.1 acetate/propionate family kinase [Elioraea tepida]
MSPVALVVNAGSSSIKLEVFEAGRELVSLAELLIEGIGSRPVFRANAACGTVLVDRALKGDKPVDHRTALAEATAWLEAFLAGRKVVVVGHRVVHGGPGYAAPLIVDSAVRAALEKLVPLAPLHQPHNLAGIDAMAALYPFVSQVACFDTAFHRGHPFVADTFALPRAFYDQGIRRYGFHGLSYEYVARRLAETWPSLAAGRVVVAHLGNGASMCALKSGRSIDSTMGFTAVDGLPMGTRCGQLDPGVLIHLMTERGMDADALTRLIYTESGLKGLSGLSNDMRALEASGSEAAAQAIDYFVYRIRKELGALAAALGGLDGLVFTAGIGENSARVRAAVCEGMEWLGIVLDPARNAAGETVLSAPRSRVTVLRIPTDEERMIALHALALVDPTGGG